MPEKWGYGTPIPKVEGTHTPILPKSYAYGINWIWFCVRTYYQNWSLKIPCSSSTQFRSLLLQELLLSRIHYHTPSPCWLRYHYHPSESEASCLLHRSRRHARSLPQFPSGVWRLLSRSRCITTITPPKIRISVTLMISTGNLTTWAIAPL